MLHVRPDTFCPDLVPDDDQGKHPENVPAEKPTASDPENKTDNFSDIDDEEIDYYILSNEDVKVKTTIWEKENGKVYWDGV